MRPLTPTRDPLRPLEQPYLIGLSCTVIISRTQKTGPPKNWRGPGGGRGSTTAEISIQAARVEISQSTEHFTE